MRKHLQFRKCCHIISKVAMLFQTSLLWSEQKQLFRILNVELEKIQVNLCLVEVDVTEYWRSWSSFSLCKEEGRKLAGFREREKEDG